MANPKNAAWYGNMLGFLPPDCGNIYYVDGNNGSNSNSGLKPDVPLLTMTYALSLCTDAVMQNDVIIVLRYPSAGAAGETWPIAVDKESVHILGANLFGASPMAWFAPPANTAAFVISKNCVEIAGLDLGAGASHGCIENSGTVWRTHIHHNDFALIRTAQDGIKMTGVGIDLPHWLIENNQFGLTVARNGIRIEHNSTRSVIRNNVFHVASGAVGIHLEGLCTAVGYILNNQFKVADAAAGEAITLSATAEVYVSGNVAGQGKVALGNNPYIDANGTGSWGINYQPGAIILPA